MKLYGRNPVIERLRTNPQSIRKIYIQQGHKDSAYVGKKAKEHGILVIPSPASKIQKLARNSNTQGLVVDIGDYEYEDFGELLDKALDKKRCVVFLDGVKDPQNLGSILRSLACLGRFSVVLPTKNSVKVTETVLRVASGGDNYVPVAQVSNLNNAIKKARDAGFTIAGTVVYEGEKIYGVQFPKHLALVIGSEEKGIRDVIRNNLDLELTIPMMASSLSFNVAQATTVLCYEVERQRRNV